MLFSRLLAAGVLANLLLLPVATVSAAEQEPNASARFRTWVSAPLMGVSLPQHIIAPQGELTFFADYRAANRDGVPLYLINRTDTTITLPSQDGDIYMKLEAQREDGVWERAQSHTGSWCGNSYSKQVLPPGQFLRFDGYMPNHGDKARVRFSCYGGTRLISNVGDGLVATEDLQIAKTDDMSLRDIPEVLTGVLLQGRQPAELEPPALSTHVAALRLLQCYSDHPKLKQASRLYADQIAASVTPNPEKAKAVDAIRAVLAAPWPKQTSPDGLFRRCVRALENKTAPATAEFGMPENEPALVWTVLANLAANEFANHRSGLVADSPPDRARWAPVIAKLADALASGSPAQMRAIAEMLAVTRLVDETLPNEFFETALLRPEPAIQRVCADTLSRRMQWTRLAELAWKLQPEGRLIVFVALACPPDTTSRQRTVRDATTPDEIKFWDHCLRTNTLKAIWELQINRGPNQGARFNRTVHDPLHDFLLTEANRSEAQAADFDLQGNGYLIRTAVEFLGEWGMTEDRQVFERLLKYRGYQKQEGSSGVPPQPYISQRYEVRDAARRALLKQGVAVPENLELVK